MSLVFSDQIDASAGMVGLKLQNRHAIVWETFDDHPSRGAQNGRMEIDDFESKTYPRWNFRGGPNTTGRERYCYPFPIFEDKPDVHQILWISVDSKIIKMEHMAWWIVHQ